MVRFFCMKILLVSKRFDFGGTENHVCDLANSLSELGHNVFLLAGKGRQISRLNPKVTFIPIKLSNILFPLNVIYYYPLLKKHKIDVIHSHHRKVIFYSAIISRITKIPLIATVHGRTRLDLKSKFSQNASDRIIFVSNHVLQVSACYEQIKDKSVVIPNSVEIIEHKMEPIPFSFTYISRVDKKHSKVILMIIKEVLPRLAKELPQITFSVIGEGKGIKSLKNEAEKLNIRMNRNVCSILGYQSEVKYIIYKSSLVLGVGRVSLEALACGVPVLSINQRKLGSIISVSNYKDYKLNNFVAIRNEAPTARDVFSLLRDFFNNQNQWHDETKIIQDFIKNDFSSHSITKRIIDTYADAIKIKVEQY